MKKQTPLRPRGSPLPSLMHLKSGFLHWLVQSQSSRQYAASPVPGVVIVGSTIEQPAAAGGVVPPQALGGPSVQRSMHTDVDSPASPLKLAQVPRQTSVEPEVHGSPFVSPGSAAAAQKPVRASQYEPVPQSMSPLHQGTQNPAPAGAD